MIKNAYYFPVLTVIIIGIVFIPSQNSTDLIDKQDFIEKEQDLARMNSFSIINTDNYEIFIRHRIAAHFRNAS